MLFLHSFKKKSFFEGGAIAPNSVTSLPKKDMYKGTRQHRQKLEKSFILTLQNLISHFVVPDTKCCNAVRAQRQFSLMK